MNAQKMNQYPVTMYGVCQALDSTETPVTVAEIINIAEFVDTPENREEVKELCTELVNANLASFTHPNIRHDKQIAYVVIATNDGVDIMNPENPLKINEKFNNVLTEIKVMTEFNDTNGAYIKGVELLNAMGANAEDLLKKFKTVQGLCELEGCLPPGLNDYRHYLYNQMKTVANNMLSEENYEAFYDCF